MIELIRRTMELGLGAAAVTQETLRHVAEELVVQGNLTKKEGSDLLKELNCIAAENQTRMKQLVNDQVRSIVRDIGLAAAGDIKLLEAKVAALEARLTKKKKSKK